MENHDNQNNEASGQDEGRVWVDDCVQDVLWFFRRQNSSVEEKNELIDAQRVYLLSACLRALSWERSQGLLPNEKFDFGLVLRHMAFGNICNFTARNVPEAPSDIKKDADTYLSLLGVDINAVMSGDTVPAPEKHTLIVKEFAEIFMAISHLCDYLNFNNMPGRRLQRAIEMIDGLINNNEPSMPWRDAIFDSDVGVWSGDDEEPPFVLELFYGDKPEVPPPATLLSILGSAAPLGPSEPEPAPETSETSISDQIPPPEVNLANADETECDCGGYCDCFRDDSPKENMPTSSDENDEGKRIMDENEKTAKEMGLHQIKETLGFNLMSRRGAAIRMLGMHVFDKFPCFREFAEKARDSESGALGEVWRLEYSSLSGGEAQRHAMEALLQHYLSHGEKALRYVAGQLKFHVMEGYCPKVALVATETESFLFVHEDEDMGCPGFGFYVYAWPQSIYKNDGNDNPLIGFEDESSSVNLLSTITPASKFFREALEQIRLT